MGCCCGSRCGLSFFSFSFSSCLFLLLFHLTLPSVVDIAVLPEKTVVRHYDSSPSPLVQCHCDDALWPCDASHARPFLASKLETCAKELAYGIGTAMNSNRVNQMLMLIHDSGKILTHRQWQQLLLSVPSGGPVQEYRTVKHSIEIAQS